MVPSWLYREQARVTARQSDKELQHCLEGQRQPNLPKTGLHSGTSALTPSEASRWELSGHLMENRPQKRLRRLVCQRGTGWQREPRAIQSLLLTSPATLGAPEWPPSVCQPPTLFLLGISVSGAMVALQGREPASQHTTGRVSHTHSSTGWSRG